MAMRMKAQTRIQGRSTRESEKYVKDLDSQALPLSLLFTPITASRILLESLGLQEYTYKSVAILTCWFPYWLWSPSPVEPEH